MGNFAVAYDKIIHGTFDALATCASVKEFPSDEDELAYLILYKENLSLYERHYALSKNENVKFISEVKS